MDLNKLVNIDNMRIDKEVLLGMVESDTPDVTDHEITLELQRLARECPSWEGLNPYLYDIKFNAWTAEMQYWLNIKALLAEESQVEQVKADPFDIIVDELRANNYYYLDLSYNHPLFGCDFAKMVHEKTGWILYRYEREGTNDGCLSESYRFEDPKTNLLYHLATSVE